MGARRASYPRTREGASSLPIPRSRASLKVMASASLRSRTAALVGLILLVAALVVAIVSQVSFDLVRVTATETYQGPVQKNASGQSQVSAYTLDMDLNWPAALAVLGVFAAGFSFLILSACKRSPNDTADHHPGSPG